MKSLLKTNKVVYMLKHIQDLINSTDNSELKTSYINKWLVKNTASFHGSISTTSCGKWTRWVRLNETPLFCCCPIRDEDCVFIEAYYELKKFVELVKKDDYYKYLLEPYPKIKHNQKAVFEWVKDLEVEAKKVIFIKSKIKIKLRAEPWEYIIIKLDHSEIPNILEFNRIYKKYYYSEEYENYK